MKNVFSQKYFVELVIQNSASISDICPVVFEDGIIYMSNEKNEYLRTVKDESDQYPYHLYFQALDSNKISGEKSPFAKEISSLYNDGPLSIYANNNKIVFSKNSRNSTVKNKNQNKTIGLYFSEKINGIWSAPEPFEHNSTEYNLTHPTISKDGNLLIFSSAKNMEITGMDLYFSTFTNGKWSSPEKFNKNINSNGNEVYPTLVGNRVYYSTNGKNDSTGLDIWSFNFDKNLNVTTPIKLDSAINTNYDDFGITFMDDLITGYFTSNRNGVDQIYSFEKKFPNLINCPVQKKISYCYLIQEHNMLDESGMPLKFIWNLGDGTTKEGYKIKHCYDTIGEYTATLNIIDTITGDIFYEVSEVKINIKAEPLPRIIFKDTLNINNLTHFETDLTYISNQPNEIIWQANDNQYYTETFLEKTTNRDSIHVKLGLLHGNDLQCVSKTFFFDTVQKAKNSFSNKSNEIILDNSLDSNEIYSVKILNSETPLPDSSFIFNDVNYPITEKYLKFKKQYEYSVGSSTELDELYLLYLEMNELGFDSELIKTEIDKTIESKKENKTFTAIYFAVSSSDVSAYNLNNIQNFIKNNDSDIKLNILGYADPTGNATANKQLSLERAKSVKNELIKLGVPSANISIKAMGELEATVEDHSLKLFRKVEIIINK